MACPPLHRDYGNAFFVRADARLTRKHKETGRVVGQLHVLVGARHASPAGSPTSSGEACLAPTPAQTHVTDPFLCGLGNLCVSLLVGGAKPGGDYTPDSAIGQDFAGFFGRGGQLDFSNVYYRTQRSVVGVERRYPEPVVSAAPCRPRGRATCLPQAGPTLEQFTRARSPMRGGSPDPPRSRRPRRATETRWVGRPTAQRQLQPHVKCSKHIRAGASRA